MVIPVDVVSDDSLFVLYVLCAICWFYIAYMYMAYTPMYWV